MESIDEQISQLEKAIEAQQPLRSTLGDAVVDTVINTLRGQIAALHSQHAPPNLTAKLDALDTAGLIRVGRIVPELEYIFKHALVQDAVYNSLLVADRRRLHQQVGVVIESTYTADLSTMYPTLAQHFYTSGDWDKAALYYQRAGDAAAQRYAHIEARGHYDKASEALTHLPEIGETVRRRIDVILGTVSVSLRADGPKRSLERLAAAEALLPLLQTSADPADKLRIGRTYYWIGHAYVHGSQQREAIGYLQKVLVIGKEIDDEELIAFPSAVIGRAYSLQGNFPGAVSLLTEALPIFARVGNWHEWILNSSQLGLSLAAQGDVTNGITYIEHGLHKAEEVESFVGICQAHAGLAVIHMMTRDSTTMLRELHAALDAARQNNDLFLQYAAFGMIGWAEARLGRFDSAREMFGKIAKITEMLGSRPAFSDWFDTAEAEMEYLAGNADLAADLAQQAAAFAQTRGMLFGEGMAQRVWGQALAAQSIPDWSAAEEHLSESARILEQSHAALEMAHTLDAWAAVRAAQGDLAGARDFWRRAFDVFSAAHLTDHITRIDHLLSTIDE